MKNSEENQEDHLVTIKSSRSLGGRLLGAFSGRLGKGKTSGNNDNNNSEPESNNMRRVMTVPLSKIEGVSHEEKDSETRVSRTTMPKTKEDTKDFLEEKAKELGCNEAEALMRTQNLELFHLAVNRYSIVSPKDLLEPGKSPLDIAKEQLSNDPNSQRSINFVRSVESAIDKYKSQEKQGAEKRFSVVEGIKNMFGKAIPRVFTRSARRDSMSGDRPGESRVEAVKEGSDHGVGQSNFQPVSVPLLSTIPQSSTPPSSIQGGRATRLAPITLVTQR